MLRRSPCAQALSHAASRTKISAACEQVSRFAAAFKLRQIRKGEMKERSCSQVLSRRHRGGAFSCASAAGNQTGVATTILCSNVSGVAVQVRVLIISPGGTITFTRTAGLSHAQTATFSTRATVLFVDEDFLLNTSSISQGVVNVEATNSAVFCTAVIVDAAASIPNGIPLHLVRVNPHPGTVE
jgi:hypothetical protein